MSQKAITTSEINDVNIKFFVSNTYDLKVFNEILVNRELYDEVLPRMKAIEVQILAGMLAAIGQPDEALKYYDTAISKAEEEKLPPANLHRDKALAALQSRRMDSIEIARAEYLSAIRLSWEWQPS